MNEWACRYNNHRYYCWAEKLMLRINWALQKNPLYGMQASTKACMSSSMNAELAVLSICIHCWETVDVCERI